MIWQREKEENISWKCKQELSSDLKITMQIDYVNFAEIVNMAFVSHLETLQFS